MSSALMPGSSAVTVPSSRQLAGGKPQANTFLTTGLLVPTGILYDTELVPLAATAALVRTKASGDELVSCSRTGLGPPVVHAVAACRLSNYCLAAVHLDVVPALLMQIVEQLFPALLRCQPQQDFLDENAELFRCVCVYMCAVCMFLLRLPPSCSTPLLTKLSGLSAAAPPTLHVLLVVFCVAGSWRRTTVTGTVLT